MTMSHEDFCYNVLLTPPYLVNPNLKFYKKLSVHGKIIASYQRDDNGDWFETTHVERAKQDVLTAKEELDKARNEAMLEEYLKMGQVSMEDKNV